MGSLKTGRAGSRWAQRALSGCLSITDSVDAAVTIPPNKGCFAGPGQGKRSKIDLVMVPSEVVGQKAHEQESPGEPSQLDQQQEEALELPNVERSPLRDGQQLSLQAPIVEASAVEQRDDPTSQPAADDTAEESGPGFAVPGRSPGYVGTEATPLGLHPSDPDTAAEDIAMPMVRPLISPVWMRFVYFPRNDRILQMHRRW